MSLSSITHQFLCISLAYQITACFSCRKRGYEDRSFSPPNKQPRRDGSPGDPNMRGRMDRDPGPPFHDLAPPDDFRGDMRDRRGVGSLHLSHLLD